MKVIAWYLPQFHEIRENNEWWGEGFTEWVNVKKAKKYFEGQRQPRIPMNNNYYNLLDDDVKKWQIELAKENGIYGFCMYHYWFDGKLLLEKPVEQYLANKELDLPFCICWANEHWTTQWKGDNYKILIEQRYGREQQWKEHFEYLYKFFVDERYIKEDGKPLIVIYRPELIECLNEMIDLWQKLAVEKGLPGLCMAYQGSTLDYKKKRDDSKFEYNIEFQPQKTFTKLRRKHFKGLRIIEDRLPGYVVNSRLLYKVKTFFLKDISKKENSYDYQLIWDTINKTVPASDKCIPGAFVDWDNSPRKCARGTFLIGANPEKFKENFDVLVKRTKKIYKKDYIFIFAWNEWCEGGYLEPDEEYKNGYLEAIKQVLIDNNEFPEYSTK